MEHLPDTCVPAFPTPAASHTALTFERPDADPLLRIVRAYDRAIVACESFDHRASRSAIGTLRLALELDSPEARSFDSLYAWCERTVDQRDFIGPARCLRSLRDAWFRAMHPVPMAPRANLPLS